MKLSKKGAQKCFDKMYLDKQPIQAINFEPEDFKDAVVLTVEEAKLLFSVIDGFFDLRLPTTKEIVALNKLKVRVERIAKAEKEYD